MQTETNINKKILIADDNPSIRYLIKRLLKKFEHIEIIEANNGQEVLKFIDKFPDSIDLILMDIMMPKMDGLTSLLNINNKFPSNRPFKVCMLSAIGEPKSIKIAIKLKIDDYIIKPIDDPIFIKKIFSLLDDNSHDEMKFATVEASLQACILNMPSEILIEVIELSEFHLRFTCALPLQQDSILTFSFNEINFSINLSSNLKCVKKISSDNYEYLGEFIGLNDEQRKMIRNITVKGKGVSNE